MTVVSDWLYLRIHPPRPDDLDDLVRTVVGGLRGPLAEEVSRWFWLRYVDRGGTHLRLRALATPRAADRIQAAAQALAPAAVRIRPAFYQREYEVFGGRAGVDLAEERFQVSSELVLGLLAEPVEESERLRLARALLTAAVVRTLRAPDRVGYLRNTAAYWANTGHPPVQRSVAGWGSVRSGDADPPSGVTERWLGGLARPAELDRTPAAPSAEQWLFRLVHLTLNRLGVPPAVEGALAAELADQLTGEDT